MWWNDNHGQRAIRVGLLALATWCIALPATTFGADTSLPDSLAQWYKPHNKRQVWLHTMFAMRRELQAVREYAQLRDGTRAANWANKLAKHYRTLAEMVPEWRDETDPTLIDALLSRVAAEDFGATLVAADKLERDCRSCHRQYQALAVLKYRWPDFSAQRVLDRDGTERPYGEHMELLSTTLNRIKIASEDQRWQVARDSLRELRGQLDALGDGCQACHDDAAPRERILGPATTATLEQLDQSLTDADDKASGRLLGEAAVQTCARCHGVHRTLAEIRRHLFD